MPNSTGTATISVIVRDNGGTSNGGIDSFIRTFTVTVTGINHHPTINTHACAPGGPREQRTADSSTCPASATVWAT